MCVLGVWSVCVWWVWCISMFCGYVCVCVYVCGGYGVYVCLRAHVCAVVVLHGGQWLTSGVLLGHSPSFVPRHLNLELAG